MGDVLLYVKNSVEDDSEPSCFAYYEEGQGPLPSGGEPSIAFTCQSPDDVITLSFCALDSSSTGGGGGGSTVNLLPEVCRLLYPDPGEVICYDISASCCGGIFGTFP